MASADSTSAGAAETGTEQRPEHFLEIAEPTQIPRVALEPKYPTAAPVGEEVHEALVRQAERAGQSLQQYLAAKLALIAATPTIDEVLDRIEHRSKGRLSREDAIAALESERARR